MVVCCVGVVTAAAAASDLILIADFEFIYN
jgi:hypothetical protein